MTESYEHDPIDSNEPFYGFEDPPESFLTECEEYWADTMKPFYTTIERKIGNTTYVIETEFAGRESLADKLHRMIMEEAENSHGFTNTRVFIDDGYTDTNFDRPGIQETLSLVEQGLVSTFIVKDMSRFGRNYLQVGKYTELIFPIYDVRFIAINDGVDSAYGDNDFTPFRNLFNDFYAKGTSKKVRTIFRAKAARGEHLGRPPCGYMDDPEHHGHWIVDAEAAKVVKRIYDLTIDGGYFNFSSFLYRRCGTPFLLPTFIPPFSLVYQKMKVDTFFVSTFILHVQSSKLKSAFCLYRAAASRNWGLAVDRHKNLSAV